MPDASLEQGFSSTSDHNAIILNILATGAAEGLLQPMAACITMCRRGCSRWHTNAPSTRNAAMIAADPPVAEWPRLKPPLTFGERQVAEALGTSLTSPWELYVQPHLNGLRPDLALLHPERGIFIIEIKDWSDEKDPRAIEAAVRKVEHYALETRELYCPSLQQAYRRQVRSYLALPMMRRNDLVASLPAHFTSEFIILTKEDMGQTGSRLEDESQKAGAMPSGARAAYSDLRHWLIEPEFNAEQRTVLEVDARQRALILSRTESGFRRIKGPSGSGKSLVLAARAAELARAGKRVLVISFNITLLNYLRDLAVRWPNPHLPARPVLDNVTWLNFHHWCKRVCEQSDRAQDYHRLWKDHGDTALDSGVAELTNKVMGEGHEETGKYDAILLDEGQDFALTWWNALRRALRPNGEMVLVADTSQDLYSRADRWTDDAMRGAGFVGPWTELQGSYRLPPGLVDLAKDFLTRFVPERLAVIPTRTQSSLPIEPVSMEWHQVAKGQDVAARIHAALLSQLRRMEALGISELVFLVASTEVGTEVVELLAKNGIKVQHTFGEDDDESRRLKLRFYKGAARVKGTTLHSFKGWESRAVVLHIGGRWSPGDIAAAYAGLTRVRRSPKGSILSVVCEARQLAGFGTEWGGRLETRNE